MFRTALAIFFLSASFTWSQEASSGLTGLVTDTTGAAIHGATVTIRDKDRGTLFPAATNEDGVYAFPRIPIVIQPFLAEYNHGQCHGRESER